MHQLWWVQIIWEQWRWTRRSAVPLLPEEIQVPVLYMLPLVLPLCGTVLTFPMEFQHPDSCPGSLCAQGWLTASVSIDWAWPAELSVYYIRFALSPRLLVLVLMEANKEKLYFLVQLQCVTVIPHCNLTTMGESLWGHGGAFLFLFFPSLIQITQWRS